jgi:hypothetical protein
MRIAFLDHHLDNWHAKVFLGLLRERGHEVVAYESHPADTGDWCAANGVPRAKSPDEALEQAEAVMVLAPDNIEAHLELCFAVLAAGKPVWVDKLLAANVDEANRIVRMAEYHSTPLTAGSSLRHAVELEAAMEPLSPPGGSAEMGDAKIPTVESNGVVPHVERGRGEDFEEGFFSGYGDWNRYGVHTVAMALRVFGGGVRRLANVGTEHMPNIALEWADGRRASLVVINGDQSGAASPWRFVLRRGDELLNDTVTQFDGFYRNQIDATLAAFESRASMDHAEMLDTVRILELAPQVVGQGWVDL